MSIEMPAQPLRMLLQDTMLHVALLTQGARISRVHDWRARCIALVRQFEQALQDGGYRGGIANELNLAQCVFWTRSRCAICRPSKRKNGCVSSFSSASTRLRMG